MRGLPLFYSYIGLMGDRKRKGWKRERVRRTDWESVRCFCEGKGISERGGGDGGQGRLEGEGMHL